jgi:hypothetical protein
MGLAVLTNYYKYREAASGKNNLLFPIKKAATQRHSGSERFLKALLRKNLNVARGEHFLSGKRRHLALGAAIRPSIPSGVTIPVQRALAIPGAAPTVCAFISGTCS